MTYSKPIAEIIRSRFSCRSYLKQTIPEHDRQVLREAAQSIVAGTLGSPLRFRVVTDEESDRADLKGLGTYGFIRNPSGFIIGAVKKGNRDLEDFGCAAESLVLRATDLGLGTCWIGGLFARGNFSRKIQLGKDESLPAVISVGVIADEEGAKGGTVRRLAGGHSRLPWDSLFFQEALGVPLSQEAAAPVATALEMVRLGPSASNKQPWRILRSGRFWHFFLQRTPGYPPGLGRRLLGVADLQRIDIGIAICHFELAMKETGLSGRWVVCPPKLQRSDLPAEYVVSWEG